jgi:hypothetical protein
MEESDILKQNDKKEMNRVIVGATVQERAVVHPTKRKLLDITRSKMVVAS